MSISKIAFLGAGSTQFARKLVGDFMLVPALRDFEIALYDIDAERLRESVAILGAMNRAINRGRARIRGYLGVRQRRAALRDARYVINAVQIGGKKRGSVLDFDIPSRYGLEQTIGDTLGIGGIFRGLRTVPVMLDFARDMEAVCPDAWMLNYTNPMAIVTGAMQCATPVRTVGLCHSWQGCAWSLLNQLGMAEGVKRLRWKIAGINHMAWLLEVRDGEKDLYPEIKRRAAAKNAAARRPGAERHPNMVRMEIMLRFGYYVTESSVHHAEYAPYWIKSRFPELIDEFGIPLGEYPRRLKAQDEAWKQARTRVRKGEKLAHERTHEYASYMLEAMETDLPFQFSGAAFEFGGNVLNKGLITNLPPDACVEVPCLANNAGIRPCHVGDLPEVCAALNRTNINVQNLTIEAALSRRREAVYHAAMLDPHTAAELSLDKIRELCDELIAAHGSLLPRYR